MARGDWARVVLLSFSVLFCSSFGANETTSDQDDDQVAMKEAEGGVNIAVALCVGGALVAFAIGKYVTHVVERHYDGDGGISAARKSVSKDSPTDSMVPTRRSTAASVENSVAEVRASRMVLEQKKGRRTVLHV